MRTLRGLETMIYQDKLYYVYRRFPKEKIKEGYINDVKELWHCDLVLKKRNEDDEMLIFLIEISDAVIDDETTKVTTTE